MEMITMIMTDMDCKGGANGKRQVEEDETREL